MYPAKISTILDVVIFAFDSLGDGVTGKADGDWTKRVSKGGGAFAAMTVTVTEMENGFYTLQLSASHTDTLGVLTVSLSASGVKRVNLQYRVHTRLPDDLAFPTTTGRSLDVTATGGAGIDWGNVENQSTSVNLSATTVNLVNTLTTYTGNTAQTGDAYVIVNSGTHGNAAIKGFVDDIGVAGAGLTAIPWNAAWDAEVQSEVDDAIVAQRLDELLAADSDIDGAQPPAVGSVFHELMSKTGGSFTFDQTTDSNEALRDRGDTAWTTATGFSTLSQADVRTAVGLASANLDTQLAAIVADTNELQVDWVNGGRLDLLVDEVKAKTDQLTFTVATRLDVNVRSVNSVVVAGAGTLVSPWGP